MKEDDVTRSDPLQRDPASATVTAAAPAASLAPGRPTAAGVLALQRSAGNQGVMRWLARQPKSADPEAAAGLPGPVLVDWGRDPFEVSFTRVKDASSDQLRFSIHYIGPHPTGGRDVKSGALTLDMPITELALAARVVRNDKTTLELDLYGDGRRRVRLVDETSFDARPGQQGRRHQLRTLGDGRSPSVGTLWVLDPKATITDTLS